MENATLRDQLKLPLKTPNNSSTPPSQGHKASGSAKAKPKGKPNLKPRRQYGALPYRAGEHLEILLITTRETRRWMIPKGWPMIGKSPRAAAAREALGPSVLRRRFGWRVSARRSIAADLPRFRH